MKSWVSVFVLMSSVLAGCQNRGVYMEDSIDLDFDLCVLCRHHPDELHLPYVSGANVLLHAHPDDPDDLSLSGAWFESSDPEVLRVGNIAASEGTASASLWAGRSGVAVLTLYRSRSSSRVLARRQIEVAAPDSAELYFAGFPLAGLAVEDGFIGDAVNVLDGGTATFLVRYFRQGRRLFGNNVLSAEAATPERTWVQEESTYVFEDREWLRVVPEEPGVHDLALYAYGRQVATLSVAAVDPEDVRRVRLLSGGERRADEDDVLAVLAVGYGDDGEPIYGVDFSWETDGWVHAQGGDLYEYVFEDGPGTVVTARFGDVEASAVVHEEAGSAWVSSSDFVGCSAGPEGNAGDGLLPGVLLLGVAAFFLLRRSAHTDDEPRS